MSQEVRNAIAAAATTVDGVNVSPYFRQITKPGQGLVRLDQTNYPNPFGGIVTWQVVVILPQDMGAAERWLDENGSALRRAVAEEMRVASMTPSQVSIPDAGSLLCVVIEGQREEE